MLRVEGFSFLGKDWEVENKKQVGPARERAIATMRKTPSGNWAVNIYGVLAGRKRLAIEAHGSQGYVERLSALYCGPALIAVAALAQAPGTSAESHSRVKTASPVEAGGAPASGEASEPRRRRP